MKLKLGIPKGSLQDATLALFERAGGFVLGGERFTAREDVDGRVDDVTARFGRVTRSVIAEAVLCRLSCDDAQDDGSEALVGDDGELRGEDVTVRF